MIVDVEILRVYASAGPYDFEYGWNSGPHWSPRPNLSIGEAQRQAEHELKRLGVLREGDQVRWTMPPTREDGR